MSIEIIDMDEGGGNIIIGNGILTGEEYLDVLKTHLHQDKEKFKRYRYSMVDWSGVTKLIGFTTGIIRTASDMCRQSTQINPDAVIAIVADQDVIFRLSRTWEFLMYGTDWDIMVFKDRDAAETWIKEQVRTQFGIANSTIIDEAINTAEGRSVNYLGFDESEVDYHIDKARNVFICGFPTRDDLLKIHQHLVKLVLLGRAPGPEYAKVKERLKKTTPASWPDCWTNMWGPSLEHLGITIMLGDVEQSRRAVEDLVRDLLGPR